MERIEWENRIVGHEMVPADQLLAHPENFRRHNANQRAALNGSLGMMGWLRSCIVNRRTGRVLDGHCRVEEALKRNAKVPVEYVDLSEEEERLALLTLDPMAAMANTDDDALAAALAEAEDVEDGALKELMESLHPGEKAAAPEVKELDVSALTTATFWLSVKGPLPEQRAALQTVIDALQTLSGVTVDLGVVE